MRAIMMIAAYIYWRADFDAVVSRFSTAQAMSSPHKTFWFPGRLAGLKLLRYQH